MAVHSRAELKFGNVGFLGEGKPEYPKDKLLGAEYMTFGPEIEPLVTIWCRHLRNGPGSYNQIETTVQYYNFL